METLGEWLRVYLPVAVVVAVPAALLWGLLVVRRSGSGGPVRRTMREAGADILLAVSVLAILALTILPGGGASRPATRRSLMPFEDLVRSLGPGMPSDAVDLAVGNLLANLLLFLPFGIALGLRFPETRRRRLVLACAGLSLAVEVVQLLLPGGRSADVTDILMNTLGGAIGLLVARAIVRLVRRRRRGAAAGR